MAIEEHNSCLPKYKKIENAVGESRPPNYTFCYPKTITINYVAKILTKAFLVHKTYLRIFKLCSFYRIHHS